MYIINKKTTSKVLYTVFTNLLFLYQKSHPFDARSLIRLQLVRKYRRLLHEVFCISFLHSKRTTIRRSRSQQCYKTLSYKNTTWRVWVACGILGPVDQPPQRACSDKTQRIRTETIASQTTIQYITITFRPSKGRSLLYGAVYNLGKCRI